jgi:hypothetical protein
MGMRSRNFFGGTPGAVLMRLVAVSFVLGIILSALGVSPLDIINGLRDLFRRIYELGWESVEWIFRYFLLGAVIVFPVWLVVRLIKLALGKDLDEDARESAKEIARNPTHEEFSSSTASQALLTEKSGSSFPHALRAIFATPFFLIWSLGGPVTYIINVVDTWGGRSSVFVKLLINLPIDAVLAAIWPITWIIWIAQEMAGGVTPLTRVLGF